MIRLDQDKPVANCYTCRRMTKDGLCTVMQYQIVDVFGLPNWCPLPEAEGQEDLERALEVERLLGVMKSTLNRKCVSDPSVEDALIAVQCEIALLVSSLKKSEKRRS